VWEAVLHAIDSGQDTRGPQGPAPEPPLRVLQLYPKGDFHTGAAVQLLELAHGLDRRGHQVAVATRPSALWADRCRALDIRHVPIPMRSGADVRSVAPLVRLIRAQDIEVVHCHKGRARTLALMASLFVPIPALVLNRGVSFPIAGGLGRLGYTHPRVTAVVAVCAAIKERLVSSGVPASKIEVIYNGTDTERFHPGVDKSRLRRELGFDAGQPIVTGVGVRPEKGNDDLLTAMVRVHDQIAEARLVFVGAGPGAMAPLQERAGQLGLAGRVRILGKRDDMPEVLAGSDVVVDASYAGLGLTGVLREALAVEVPVIATCLEGNPELVRDGETGRLVPPATRRHWRKPLSGRSLSPPPPVSWRGRAASACRATSRWP
jgi:glycosyltransferase involved in cell wall biosynthesis